MVALKAEKTEEKDLLQIYSFLPGFFQYSSTLIDSCHLSTERTIFRFLSALFQISEFFYFNLKVHPISSPRKRSSRGNLSAHRLRDRLYFENAETKQSYALFPEISAHKTHYCQQPNKHRNKLKPWRLLFLACARCCFSGCLFRSCTAYRPFSRLFRRIC